MSGFIGCVHGNTPIFQEAEKQLFKNMNNMITHRGPDDDGYYMDDHVQFGFRRLSIIDIESGHQPLTYDNERYWIIFDGEVYNYVELREELLQEGLHFETNSETEVIIALYSLIGEKAVERLRGMFAFVIWDKQCAVMFLLDLSFQVELTHRLLLRLQRNSIRTLRCSQLGLKKMDSVKSM